MTLSQEANDTEQACRDAAVSRDEVFLPNAAEQVSQESARLFKALLGGAILSSAIYAVAILRELRTPRLVPLAPEWSRQYYNALNLRHGLLTGDPAALMLVATFMMTLTPVVRVLASVCGYRRLNDRKMVVVCGTVLGVMLLSLALGLVRIK